VLFASCASTQELQYKGFDNFTVTNVLKEPKVELDLNLYNPNPIGGTIRNMEINIAVDNNELGKVSLDDKVRIKKQSAFTLPISFTTSTSEMGGILSAGLKSFLGQDQMPMGISGEITIQKFLIFRKTFTFEYKDGIDVHDIIQK
jgi:hypothetical protein